MSPIRVAADLSDSISSRSETTVAAPVEEAEEEKRLYLLLPVLLQHFELLCPFKLTQECQRNTRSQGFSQQC